MKKETNNQNDIFMRRLKEINDCDASMNETKTMVSFRELVDSEAFQNAESKLSFVVGKANDGQIVIGDIAKMPHIRIAGSSGSGKTVCIKSIIMSILHKATPEDVRMIIIDPKWWNIRRITRFLTCCARW